MEIFPLVTIAIPTLNRKHYLLSTITSVISQTYNNLEVIVSDNGSNYSVNELINELLTKDTRIIYRRNDKTIPATYHFNQCLDIARGKYFLLLSDDDLISNNYIEEMVKGFQSEKSISIGLAKSILIDEHDNIAKSLPLYSWNHENGYEFLKNWLWGKDVASVPTFISMFMQTMSLRDIGGFPHYQDGSHSENFVCIALGLRGNVFFSKSAIFSYRFYKASYGLSISYKSHSNASKQFINDLRCNAILKPNLGVLSKNKMKIIIHGASLMALITYWKRLRPIYNLKGIKLILAMFAYKPSLLDIMIVVKYKIIKKVFHIELVAE